MGGEAEQEVTGSTASSSAELNDLINSLAGGLGDIYTTGADPVYANNLYADAGATTQDAWKSALTAAGNTDFTDALSGVYDYGNSLTGGLTSGQTANVADTNAVGDSYAALAASAGDTSLSEQELMGYATGDMYGMDDPGYAALRTEVGDDTLSSINSQFTNSGRFGGGTHVESATEGLANAYAALDYENYQQDYQKQMDALAAIEGQRQEGYTNETTALAGQAGAESSAYGMEQQGTTNVNTWAAMLPSLFEAGMMPSSVAGAVGAAQDTDAQNALTADKEYADRIAGQDTDFINDLVAALTGLGSSDGTTTSEATTPWYEQLIGYMMGAAGNAVT